MGAVYSVIMTNAARCCGVLLLTLISVQPVPALAEQGTSNQQPQDCAVMGTCFRAIPNTNNQIFNTTDSATCRFVDNLTTNPYMLPTSGAGLDSIDTVFGLNSAGQRLRANEIVLDRCCLATTKNFPAPSNPAYLQSTVGNTSYTLPLARDYIDGQITTLANTGTALTVVYNMRRADVTTHSDGSTSTNYVTWREIHTVNPSSTCNNQAWADSVTTQYIWDGQCVDTGTSRTWQQNGLQTVGTTPPPTCIQYANCPPGIMNGQTWTDHPQPDERVDGSCPAGQTGDNYTIYQRNQPMICDNGVRRTNGAVTRGAELSSVNSCTAPASCGRWMLKWDPVGTNVAVDAPACPEAHSTQMIPMVSGVYSCSNIGDICLHLHTTNFLPITGSGGGSSSPVTVRYNYECLASSACNTVSYSWEPSGTCNGTCGTGTEDYVCKDSNGAVVADSNCSGTKPAARSCTLPNACTACWNVVAEYGGLLSPTNDNCRNGMFSPWSQDCRARINNNSFNGKGIDACLDGTPPTGVFAQSCNDAMNNRVWARGQRLASEFENSYASPGVGYSGGSVQMVMVMEYTCGDPFTRSCGFGLTPQWMRPSDVNTYSADPNHWDNYYETNQWTGEKFFKFNNLVCGQANQSVPAESQGLIENGIICSVCSWDPQGCTGYCGGPGYS